MLLVIQYGFDGFDGFFDGFDGFGAGAAVAASGAGRTHLGQERHDLGRRWFSDLPQWAWPPAK